MDIIKKLLTLLWILIFHKSDEYEIFDINYVALKFHRYRLYRRYYFFNYFVYLKLIDNTNSLMKNTKDYESWAINYQIKRIKTIIK